MGSGIVSLIIIEGSTAVVVVTYVIRKLKGATSLYVHNIMFEMF